MRQSGTTAAALTPKVTSVFSPPPRILLPSRPLITLLLLTAACIVPVTLAGPGVSAIGASSVSGSAGHAAPSARNTTDPAVTARVARKRLTVDVGRRAQRTPSWRLRASGREAVTVPGRNRLQHNTAPRARHSMRLWVRSVTRHSRATLVVREVRSGTRLQSVRRTATLPRGTWVRINRPIRVRHGSSRLAVRLRIPRSAGPSRIDVAKRAVAIPRRATSCRISARGVPGCGTYLGMAYGSNTDPAEVERRVGGTVGVRRTYFTASQVAGAMRHARADLARNRLPWISFKLPHSWDRMASGAGDAWVRDLTKQMAQLPGPVWVAFHHEPEYDGDINDWRRMQQRLGPMVRKAPNVGFTVIVTGWHQFYGDAQFRLASMWPRGIKVDVAGFDIYNQLGVVKDGRENTKGTDLRSAYFKQISAWAADQGIAWGLAETGYTHKAAELDPQWLARTYGEMEAMGGVAFAYFNTTLNSIAPWDLSTTHKITDFSRALTGTIRLSGG